MYIILKNLVENESYDELVAMLSTDDPKMIASSTVSRKDSSNCHQSYR